MDKLLCALGMGLIVFFVKMKTWLEGAAELVKGADGCSLSCRMNCRIADREAVRGLKMI